MKTLFSLLAILDVGSCAEPSCHVVMPGLPSAGRCHSRHLGLRRGRGECAGKPCLINEIGLEKKLRTAL